MMYDIIRSDERYDRANWGRTMRGAQNGCNGLPARHDNKPSRVGEVHWQIRRKVWTCMRLAKRRRAKPRAASTPIDLRTRMTKVCLAWATGLPQGELFSLGLPGIPGTHLC